MYWILVGGSLLISMFVSWRFRSKFEFYVKEPLSSRLTGKSIAEKMLKDHGIFDVQVISIPSKLGDHYNPVDKTVNLSPDVYHGANIAAAAVAAHECGHAVQHAKAYSWLNFRSAMVPMLSVTSKWMMLVIMGGLLILNFTHNSTVLWLGIILFALTTVFAFITLPVEFDASRRALVWLDSARITNSAEYRDAKDALWWAATTYVVAALSSLATLIYYIMLASGGNRKE